MRQNHKKYLSQLSGLLMLGLSVGLVAQLHAQSVTRMPTSPDPHKGKYTLAEATKGMAGKGKLTAQLKTSKGLLTCELFEKVAPNTVANFVGLARGQRAFWDAKQAKWVKRAHYDGTTFHRVIPGFMIQGGDNLGDGTGGVGYEIADELDGKLKHDKAGLLCMANRGPNTNGGQFFIMDAAASHLDDAGTYTIFGNCTPTSVVNDIARAERDPRNDKPKTNVVIEKVTISRAAK